MKAKRYLHSLYNNILSPFTLLTLLTAAITTTACYSNNCPMENTVVCNYYFYDAEGTPITYGDEITVTTLMPGTKTVYTYRKLGYMPVTLDYINQDMIDDGYTMTESEQRNDTILLNKKSQASSITIPMSYFNNADTLVIAYSSITQKDTLIIQKESYAHVELPECGTHRFHTLKSIKCTDAAIDHAEIANPTVNYQGAENVKIFFNAVAN